MATTHTDTPTALLQAGRVRRLSEQIAMLGCINDLDGSGYIHCLLVAYHPTYSRLRNGNYRVYTAKAVRLGAIPDIIKHHYKPEDLSRYPTNPRHFTIDNPHAVYKNASTYGSPLRVELLKHYAEYLGVSYDLYDTDFNVVESYEHPNVRCPKCSIIRLSDNEYHLLVRVLGKRSGDADGTTRYTVTNVPMDTLENA